MTIYEEMRMTAKAEQFILEQHRIGRVDSKYLKKIEKIIFTIETRNDGFGE